MFLRGRAILPLNFIRINKMAYKPPSQTVTDNDVNAVPSSEAVFEELKLRANTSLNNLSITGQANQVLKWTNGAPSWGNAPAPTPLAQTVVSLSDAATITVDASQGNIFRVTLGGNRTLGNPSNPTDGQILQFEIKQDATGGRTLAYDTKYRFSADLVQPTLSTGANKLDRILFIYRSADDKFDCLAVNKGF